MSRPLTVYLRHADAQSFRNNTNYKIYKLLWWGCYPLRTKTKKIPCSYLLLPSQSVRADTLISGANGHLLLPLSVVANAPKPAELPLLVQKQTSIP